MHSWERLTNLRTRKVLCHRAEEFSGQLIITSYLYMPPIMPIDRTVLSMILPIDNTVRNSEQRTLSQPPMYLSQYKITSKNGQWSYIHRMRMLVNAFIMPPSLDSKTENYITTVAHRASHSRQRKATRRVAHPQPFCPLFGGFTVQDLVNFTAPSSSRIYTETKAYEHYIRKLTSLVKLSNVFTQFVFCCLSIHNLCVAVGTSPYTVWTPMVPIFLALERSKSSFES